MTAAAAPMVTREATASAASTTIGWLVLVGALAIWAAALRVVDPGMMTDLGLASTMPLIAWLPFILLSFGFFFLIGSGEFSKPLAIGYIAALIVVLHVTPILEYGTLRYPWTWKHIGLVDYFQRHGALNPATPLLGAYHNWPGLFAAVAMIAELLGVDDISTAASWWPPIVTALSVAALTTITRQFSADSRVVYASLWMFVAGNWIGQDYFAPQSAAFLFYLALLCVCLAFIINPSPAFPLGDDAPLPKTAARPRILPANLAQSLLDGFPDGRALTGFRLFNGNFTTTASGIALFLIAAITPTHQFTPIVVMVLLAGFVVVRLAGPGLFLFSAACFVLWTMYAAAPYLAAHLSTAVHGAGTVTNFTSNLIDTGSVSPGQAIVSWASRGLTVAIGLAAVIGFLRRIAVGYRDLIAVMLILAPIPIGLVTSYGGEVIFRVYLFALPGLAFFAATAIFPTPDRGRSFVARTIAALFGLALAVGFVFANNGKDRQYVASRDEIAAVEWLYDNAPPGSLLIEGATVYPRQMRNYENFSYVSLADEPAESMQQFIADPANILSDWLNGDAYAAGYVVITRSQKAFVDAVRPMPKGTLDDIEQRLLASPRFLLVRETDTVKIFTANPGVQPMGAWVKP
jgi:hypothetical protein